MKILSIDTATKCASIALSDGEQCLEERFYEDNRGQAQNLIPEIQTILKNQNLTFEALDRLAVITGPGSFTGIRIGLATMRAIALAAEKPVIGIDSFDAFYQAHNMKEPAIVAIESNRPELYFQIYNEEGVKEGDPLNIKPEIFTEVLREQGKEGLRFIGDTTQNADQLEHTLAYYAGQLASKRDPETEMPQPFYIRPADVTVTEKKNREISETAL